MNISLCMIVKNEEKNIEKCLESVKNYVSEMIIVDTGSIDKTKEIAIKYGARVYDFEWNDNFSSARNESLKYATGDWVLVLDADEEIVEWKEDIQLFLQQTKKEAFQLKIEHQKETQGHHHFSVRFFKNHQNIGYQSRIHEQLVKNNALLEAKNVGILDISLMHTGYQEKEIDEKNKDERNMRLLEIELKEQPKNRVIHYHMANQCLKMKDETKAMYHYKIATDYKKDKEMFKHSVLKMILALYRLKRYDELFQTINEGKTYYPDYTDIYYSHGEILESLGHDEGAVIEYRKCLELGEVKNDYYSKKGIGRGLPLLKLKNLYFRHFNQEKETEVALIAFQHQQNNLKEAERFFELQEREIGYEATLKMIEMVYGQREELIEVKDKIMLRWQLKNGQDKNELMEEAKEIASYDLTKGIHYLLNHHSNEMISDLLNEMDLEIYENKLTVAEFYYQNKEYQKTIQWATDALNLNNESFRPINLILMSAEKLGEKEQTRLLAKEMLKMIPHDEFFSKFN